MSIFGKHEDQAIARSLVAAYGTILAALEEMRAESAHLDDLLAIATIADEISAKRRHQAARLRKMDIAEDHAWSGHGKAQRAGAGYRAGSPAVKGHGCPALPFVGNAPGSSNVAGNAALSSVDITSPDNPLFFASERKKLLGRDNRVNTQSASASEAN